MSLHQELLDKHGVYPVMPIALMQRNFMADVKGQHLSEEEVRQQIQITKEFLERLQALALSELSSMSKCEHAFSSATGTASTMLMGDIRNSWKRTCANCGKTESFSCMSYSDEAKPEWTENVKLRFIPSI